MWAQDIVPLQMQNNALMPIVGAEYFLPLFLNVGTRYCAPTNAGNNIDAQKLGDSAMRNIKKICFGILISTLLITLAGCGFKLRTSSSLPPQLQTLYLQADSPYEALATKFKKELTGSGVNLAENTNAALTTLHLTTSNFAYNDTSVGPSTQARVYHLVLSTTIQIIATKGQNILGPRYVETARDLTLPPNEIFESSTQVEVTKQSMRQELLVKIFNILSSKEAFAKLADTTR
jgi:LPS-assembly lipoprotein